jgi:hypothetical protein
MRYLLIEETSHGSVCGGIVAIVLLFLFVSTPTQDYALSVDAVISKGDFGTYPHVFVKNTGRQTVTNVRVDYGNQAKPDLIPVINPGDRIMLSPPDRSDMSQVRVTADRGIDIVQQYRSPTNAPLIGNGGFGQ